MVGNSQLPQARWENSHFGEEELGMTFFFFQNVLKYLSSFSTNTGRQLKHKTSPVRQSLGNRKQ